jgi:hypothetical protein
VPAKFESVDAAAAIHAGEPRRRWHLEAGLLAGQGTAAVAGRCGESPKVVGRYRDLFYAVGGLLDAPDALMALVFQGRREDQPSPDDEEHFLKYYSVTGGPLAVDAVRDYYDCRDLLRVPPAGLSPEQGRQRVRLLRVHVALLARCLGSGASALKQHQELAALAGRMEDEYAGAVDLTGPLRPPLSCEGPLSGLQPRERAAALEVLARPAAPADRCA